MRSRIAARSSNLQRASRKYRSIACVAGNGVMAVLLPGGYPTVGLLRLKQALVLKADQGVQAAGAKAFQVEGHILKAEFFQAAHQAFAEARIRQARELRRGDLHAGKLAF